MSSEIVPLNICVLTISDSRDDSTDTSGQYLVEAATAAGHKVIEKRIVKDDVYQIRAVTSQWIVDPEVHVVISTGGTGFTGRDTTPEAMSVLFDYHIDGFGELFRHLSYVELGTSTVQSRALAGIANRTGVFCLPGSTGACKTGWNGILLEQLDSNHKPCNFVKHFKV